MLEKYHIEGETGSRLIDGRIDLTQGNKTLEQLRQDFYEKWDNNFVTAFPLLQEGESQEQLLEKREIYQRAHTEIYSLSSYSTGKDIRAAQRHIIFMREAKLAGFQIEATVAIDTSKPWYRRILRREPRRTEVTYVLIAPPRPAPKS